MTFTSFKRVSKGVGELSKTVERSLLHSRLAETSEEVSKESFCECEFSLRIVSKVKEKTCENEFVHHKD